MGRCLHARRGLAQAGHRPGLGRFEGFTSCDRRVRQCNDAQERLGRPPPRSVPGSGSDWQVDFVRALGDGFAVTLDVTVAVDASGTALAAWTEGDELWWNQHSPDGGWGAVEQLQSADSRTPLLAMNPQGDAMLVWSRT